MRKIIKWTAIFVAMFGISTLLSMVAGNDVSWAAFTDETNWGVGVLFAPLLTAACWALWPTPTYSPFDGLTETDTKAKRDSLFYADYIGNRWYCSYFNDDDYYHSNDNFMKDE